LVTVGRAKLPQATRGLSRQNSLGSPRGWPSSLSTAVVTVVDRSLPNRIPWMLAHWLLCRGPKWAPWVFAR
jgi:hypothetical protein